MKIVGVEAVCQLTLRRLEWQRLLLWFLSGLWAMGWRQGWNHTPSLDVCERSTYGRPNDSKGKLTKFSTTGGLQQLVFNLNC